LLALRREPYGTIEQEDRHRSAALTQSSREQNLLTQAIALDYASLGASFYSGGKARPLEKWSTSSPTKLERLERTPKNSRRIKQTLNSVCSKWRLLNNRFAITMKAARHS
jgi:hypothetical protein